MSAHGRAIDSVASVPTCHPLSLHRKMPIRFTSVSCLRTYMRRQQSSQGRNASPSGYYSSHSVSNQSKERGTEKRGGRRERKKTKNKPPFKPTKARAAASRRPRHSQSRSWPPSDRPLASNVRPSRRANNDERPRHLDVPLASHAAASRSPLSVHRACGPALPNSPHPPCPPSGPHRRSSASACRRGLRDPTPSRTSPPPRLSYGLTTRTLMYVYKAQVRNNNALDTVKNKNGNKNPIQASSPVMSTTACFRILEEA
ncbi:hypothetical protein LZ31DRAFT_341108 [Colletotrichum somersetense]|nr:hypothetical protein LZ31DRAFT_341108 [Colletotrichum somersetense]